MDYLALAKKLIAEGDEEQARSIIMKNRRLPSTDPESHFQWGLLCE